MAQDKVTRSIKLRLIVPRDASPESTRVREALMTTHRVMNEGIRQFMRTLLSFRQRDVNVDLSDDDDPEFRLTANKAKTEALELARKAQRKNLPDTANPPGTNEEVLAALRALYEELVPSSVGKKGDSQKVSRKWLSPLVDRASKGGLMLNHAGVSLTSLTSEQLAAMPSADLLASTGAGAKGPPFLGLPPAAPERSEAEPVWRKKRIERLLQQAAQADSRLRELHLLPLMTLPLGQARLESEGKAPRGVCTSRDRDMFQQALERLLSWESWDSRVKDERRELNCTVSAKRAALGFDSAEWAARLRSFEEERHSELAATDLGIRGRYRILPRQLRGWDRIRDAWRKLRQRDAGPKDFVDKLGDLQAKHSRDFGDPKVFRWLAQPEQHSLWDEDEDYVRALAELNRLERELESKRRGATCTMPEPRCHPLWARYGHAGDSNLESYALSQERDGRSLSTVLPLLELTGSDSYRQENHRFSLAPSAQWTRRVSLLDEKQTLECLASLEHKSGAAQQKGAWIAVGDPAGQVLLGTLRGARLQFDRKGLERSEGDRWDPVPAAYLNVTFELAVDSLPQLRAFRIVPEEPVQHLVTDFRAQGDKDADKTRNAKTQIFLDELSLHADSELPSEYRDLASAPLRVMSVDLGIRQLGAASVFRVQPADKPHGNKLSFPISGTDRPLAAVHERSFLIQLPGETVPYDDPQRTRIAAERLVLRACVNRLRDLQRLRGAELDEAGTREERFNALFPADDEESGGFFARHDPDRRARIREILPETHPSLPAPVSDLIKRALEKDCIALSAACHPVFALWENRLGRAIGLWRKASRLRTKRSALAHLAKGEPEFPDLVAALRRWWTEVSEHSRAGPFSRLGGLALWWIDELERTRKLLNSWSAHARSPLEIVRPKARWRRRRDEVAREVDLDERLLTHINRLKEDRRKQGAHALLMAALGYEIVFDRTRRGRWERRHAPVQVVLFEDLSRYRFRSDRPRFENSRLMQWSHRSLIETFSQQAEAYGIRPGSVAAEFSSKHHAASGAPGVRCRRLTPEDIEADRSALIERLAQENDWHEGYATKLCPGHLVPSAGGDVFVSLDDRGRVRQMHADINAAQNLQRRFWTKHGDAFRVRTRPCHTTEDGPCLLPDVLSSGSTIEFKRGTRGIGYSKLVPLDTSSPDSPCRAHALTQPQYRKLLKRTTRGAPEPTIRSSHDTLDDDTDIEETLGKARTLFHDTSGNVVPPKDGASWYPAKVFWGRVRSRIERALKDAGHLPS